MAPIETGSARRKSALPRPLRRGLKQGKKVLDAAAAKVLNGFVNGVSLLTDGERTPVGATPSVMILRRDKLAVHYVGARATELVDVGTEDLPIGPDKAATPVLLIPPLMVQPYIYDLRPGHSLVRFLRNHGFDTYILDFGIPGKEDEYVRLDDYVADYIPAAVDEILRHSGAPQINLAGYCMGGIFALLYTAHSGGAKVRNLVCVGSPVDFGKLGVLSYVARAAGGRIDPFVDLMGNIPGEIPTHAMKITDPIRSLTRVADLFVNLYDDEYVKGYESIQTWTNNLIPYPGAAFKQFVREMMRGNRMIRNRMALAGRQIDLASITQPVLAFGGANDQVAQFASVREITRAVGSKDVTLLKVPGGHIGVIAGSAAPERVWRVMTEWLRERDGERA